MAISDPWEQCLAEFMTEVRVGHDSLGSRSPFWILFCAPCSLPLCLGCGLWALGTGMTKPPSEYTKEGIKTSANMCPFMWRALFCWPWRGLSADSGSGKVT